jgi:hypothetical protein
MLGANDSQQIPWSSTFSVIVRERRRRGVVVATCALPKSQRTPIDDATALFFLLTSEHGDDITGQIRSFEG